MTDSGKSLSPCTFYAAYSSSKSSSTSYISHSTYSPSNRVSDEGRDREMHMDASEANLETMIRDECIERFIDSISQPNVSDAVTLNLLATPQEQHDRLTAADPTPSSPDCDNFITETSLQTKIIPDLILQGNYVDSVEAVSKSRFEEGSSASKRSDSGELVKKRKVESSKFTPRSNQITPYLSMEHLEAVNKPQEEKEKAKQKRLLQGIEPFFQYPMQKYSTSYLFEKLSEGFVCEVCLKSENVHECSGKCGEFYHRECLTNDGSDWYDAHMERTCSEGATIAEVQHRFECAACLDNSKLPCFVCSADSGAC